MKTLLVSLVIALGQSGSTAAPVPTHLLTPPVPTTFGAVPVGETFVWCGRLYVKLKPNLVFVYATSSSDSMPYMVINAHCFVDTGVQPRFEDDCPVNQLR